MPGLREEQLVGIDSVEAVAALLSRARGLHPSLGLWEPADFSWWWRTPRSTDTVGQLFWFDSDGRPAAAVIATDWGGDVALDPIVLPDASPEWVAHVVDRGVDHARSCGFGAVEVLVDRADDVLHQALARHGFVLNESNKDDVECWLDADNAPSPTALHTDYRFVARSESAERPHHMVEQGGPEIEARLQQTPLYRADLDLCVLDSSDGVAGYGLFWFDPTTSTGLVEPMRTAEDHQRRGIARHVLTSGVDRLVKAGATRIKVVYTAGNLGARDLYHGVGFEPVKTTAVFAGNLQAG